MKRCEINEKIHVKSTTRYPRVSQYNIWESTAKSAHVYIRMVKINVVKLFRTLIQSLSADVDNLMSSYNENIPAARYESGILLYPYSLYKQVNYRKLNER